MTTGTVTGRLVSGETSRPLSGWLEFTLSAPMVLTSVGGAPAIVAPQKVRTALAGDGTFSVVLQATDDPDATPTGTQWTVTFGLTDAQRRNVPVDPFTFELPGGATVDLATVAPVAAASPNLSLLTRAEIDALKDSAASLPAAIADAVSDYLTGNPVTAGYLHVQTVPLAQWTIPHSLGRRPAVAVFVGDELVDADVSATSTVVTVTFPNPTTGSAVLN